MRYPILTDSGNVTEEFLLSPPIEPQPNIPHEIIGEGEDLDFSIVTEKFNNLADTPGDPSVTDGEMAAFIHKNLKLTTYEASHHKFWQYLTVAECPKYVGWRFKARPAPWNRFLGAWYKNALGRLWWWAEVTYDPNNPQNPYSCTIRAAKSQELMRETIEGLWCGNKNLVKKVCDIACPENGNKLEDIPVRRLVMRINALLVTRVLDSLDEAEIENVVNQIAKELGIPETPDPKVKKKSRWPNLLGRPSKKN